MISTSEDAIVVDHLNSAGTPSTPTTTSSQPPRPFSSMVVRKSDMEQTKVSTLTLPSFYGGGEGGEGGEGSTYTASTLSDSYTATTDSVATRDIPLIEKGKLLCREEEGKVLFGAFQKVRSTMEAVITGEVFTSSVPPTTRMSSSVTTTTQVVMIHGPTGIGKTALALSLRQAVWDDGGYFVSGKFDQSSQVAAKPHDAFSTAFAGFCSQVLERGEVVKNEMREQILEKVDIEGGRVLTAVIPELEQILHVQRKEKQQNDDDVQPVEEDTSRTRSSEAINRFKYLFRLFLRAVSSPDHPLVLFLDDIHWADESSLDLLWSLINDTSNKGVLFLCTVRDDANNDLLDKQLSFLNRRVELTKIHLRPFTEEQINRILSDVLNTPEDKTKTLTNLVRRQTKGNIFFLVELLRTLREENMLRYDRSNNEWTWDIEEIGIEFGCVRDLLDQRVNKVSAEARDLLKLSACLGSKLNEDLLNNLMEAPVFSLLREASERGLLQYNYTTTSFEFSHDGIKDVIYNLIPFDDRNRFHYQIGRRLWKAYPVEDLFHTNNTIYVILGQLVLGSSQITDQRERSAVAKLCLQAGIRATQQSSFQTAYTYLTHGIEFLGSRKWLDDYELCLSLHNFAAEVAYCTANFESVFRLVEETMQHAKGFNDTIAVQSTTVYALGGIGKMKDAIDRGLDVLKQLGVEFPASLRLSDVGRGLRKMNKLLKGHSSESLLRLPPVNEPLTVAAMHMLNLLFAYAFLSKVDLAPFIAFKMVEITLKSGMCAVSCFGFGLYGAFLCGVGNDIDEGYRYGKLAIAMNEHSAAKPWFGRVSAAFYGLVQGWKRPMTESFEPLRLACRAGMESGDIEFAMINANLILWAQLDYESLPALDKEIASMVEQMKFYGQETTLTMLYPLWQLINNHMGKARGDPRRLIGDVFDETKFDAKRFPTIENWCFFHRMMLSYTVGDYDQALIEAEGCKLLISYPLGASDVAVVILYDALTNLAIAARNKKRNRKYIVQAEHSLKRLTLWAKHSPLNFLGRQFLVEAELAAVKGNTLSALSKYTSAVALSREAGMLTQTALANERAARYCLSIGDTESGHPFLKEAFRLYREWGGNLKLGYLEEEFGKMGDSS